MVSFSIPKGGVSLTSYIRYITFACWVSFSIPTIKYIAA